MPKTLQDILAMQPKTIVPVKKIETNDDKSEDSVTLGKDPAVDYAPDSSSAREFLAKHKVQKHSSRVRDNDDEINNARKVTYSLKTKQNSRMGNDLKKSEKEYE